MVLAKKKTETQKSSTHQTTRAQIHSGEEIVEATIKLTRMIEKGWKIRLAKGDADDQLKATNENLADNWRAGINIVLPGVCRVTINHRTTFKVTDEAALRKV